MSRRAFFAAAVLATLLVAGVASFYASGHPDGLEYVAEKTGFLDSADDHATADWPFADYATRGVGNERVSGGLAGVVGVVLVGAIGGGLFWALRRKDSETSERHDHTDTDNAPRR